MSAGGGGAALVPRLLRAAVALLDEGGLEARTAGKRMLWALRGLLDGPTGGGGGGGGEEFKRALARLDCKTDKVGGWVGETGVKPWRNRSAPAACADSHCAGAPASST